jgi:hypothetical protein
MKPGWCLGLLVTFLMTYITVFWSRNSLLVTHGDKSKGSWVAWFVGSALEAPGFSPGVATMELREVKCGWWNGLSSFFQSTPLINNVTQVPVTRHQFHVTLSERYLERNKKVPGRPGSWRSPWNLLVSLRVLKNGVTGCYMGVIKWTLASSRGLQLIQIRLVSVINKVTRVPKTRLQAPVALSERHLEINQKIPGRPGSWRPPWNLLVSLQVSRKRSYGRLNVGDQMDLIASSRGLQQIQIRLVSYKQSNSSSENPPSKLL